MAASLQQGVLPAASWQSTHGPLHSKLVESSDTGCCAPSHSSNIHPGAQTHQHARPRGVPTCLSGSWSVHACPRILGARRLWGRPGPGQGNLLGSYRGQHLAGLLGL